MNFTFAYFRISARPHLQCIFFTFFIYTAKVVTNTVHKSTYNAPRYLVNIHYLQMLNVKLPTYDTPCYLLINITYTTLTAYITLRYTTFHTNPLNFSKIQLKCQGPQTSPFYFRCTFSISGILQVIAHIFLGKIWSRFPSCKGPMEEVFTCEN